MTGMIERMARAIWRCRIYSDTGQQAARAALEAMREPTPAMRCAMLLLPHGSSVTELWRAAIDAALNEKGERQ